MLQWLSLALNLTPKDSLGQHHARSLFDSSLVHYPTVSLPSDGLVRNPAHSDFGTLTLLFQDAVGGLDIADTSSTNSEISARVERSGEFIPINPKPGTVLVNVGYLLMRWSIGRWKNTIHRVQSLLFGRNKAYRVPNATILVKEPTMAGKRFPRDTVSLILALLTLRRSLKLFRAATETSYQGDGSLLMRVNTFAGEER